MIYRLILIGILLMATCLSALGDESATNSSIAITSISPQIDSTLKGKTTDFTINVNYDLKDNDYGNILLSINEYTTGSADQVYTISPGDLSKGSHVFKINKLLGKDWKSAYVSATLYAAKKDKPLPAEYSAFDYRQFSFETSPNKSVILDMCSLPSTQGWKYVSGGNSFPENSAFSIQDLDQGCILHQDTMGVGQANQGSNGYQIDNVVDPSKPFVLKVRARVLAEEGDTNKNHFGFGFEVCTGAEAFAITIGPSEIQALDNENENRVLSTSIDNTKFHNYRLEGTPGVGYRFYVDNDLIATGATRVMECDNSLYLGDGTGGTNAKADIASFEFAQGGIVLDPCALPSTQGWTYTAIGNSYPEERVFSSVKDPIEGCILHQDSMGVGFTDAGGSNGYQRFNVVDPVKPFILKTRARVLEEEQMPSSDNHFGLHLGVYTGTEGFVIGLGPKTIEDLNSRILSRSIDNTIFHDYRLEGTPGGGYKFYVDDILVETGTTTACSSPNSLFLGDGTGRQNAKADIASFEFTQSEEKNVSTTNQVPPTISGHWKGKLYQFGPTYLWRTYPFSMDLSQNGSQIFGTSRIELGDYYAVMKLSGLISDGVISYNDSSFLEKNEASDWYFVLGKADLNFVNTSPPVLEGPWTGPGNCWPGSIFLMKQ